MQITPVFLSNVKIEFKTVILERKDVRTLVDLCSEVVALHIPFEQVEKMYSPVPEEVQLKIAFLSFPDNEEDIRYALC